MLDKSIEICIGTDRVKRLRVRLSLLIKENDIVQFEHFHSLSLEPGADLAAVRAAVESHLADPAGGIPFAPWPAIPNAEWADVEAHIGIIHKPEVVAKYQADRAAAIEALKGNS